MATPADRERVRRMRIRLAALRRHAAAKDPNTGKSELAVLAGKASARQREGDVAWGLDMAIKRWYPSESTRPKLGQDDQVDTKGC